MRRLVRAYGKCVDALLNGAKSQTDLGKIFGADLSEAEVRYLAQNEWAMTGEDIVRAPQQAGLAHVKGAKWRKWTLISSNCSSLPKR